MSAGNSFNLKRLSPPHRDPAVLALASASSAPAAPPLTDSDRLNPGRTPPFKFNLSLPPPQPPPDQLSCTPLPPLWSTVGSAPYSFSNGICAAAGGCGRMRERRRVGVSKGMLLKQACESLLTSHISALPRNPLHSRLPLHPLALPLSLSVSEFPLPSSRCAARA